MSNFMSPVSNVMRRELAGYFATPVAWVFIVIFLVMAGAFTFYIGYAQRHYVFFFGNRPFIIIHDLVLKKYYRIVVPRFRGSCSQVFLGLRC